MSRSAEMKEEKSIEQIALLELTRNARILQRQLKIMRGMPLSLVHQKQVNEIISNLEKEFNIYKI